MRSRTHLASLAFYAVCIGAFLLGGFYGAPARQEPSPADRLPVAVPAPSEVPRGGAPPTVGGRTVRIVVSESCRYRDESGVWKRCP